MPGAELAHCPAGVVGQVADGAAETREGGGTASKWRSQDASPASPALTVCTPLAVLGVGRGWDLEGLQGREQVRPGLSVASAEAASSW